MSLQDEVAGVKCVFWYLGDPFTIRVKPEIKPKRKKKKGVSVVVIL